MNLTIFCLIIGVINIGFTFSITIPQLYSIFKTKNTSGTSLVTYIIFVVSEIIWVAWSFSYYLIQISNPIITLDWLFKFSLVPIVFANLGCLLFSITILIFKIIFLKKAKKLKTTEFQLSKVLSSYDKGKNWWQKYKMFVLILFCILSIIFIVCTILLIYAKPIIQIVDNFNSAMYIVMSINITAAISWEAVSWPQLIKTLKRKDTTGISLGWSIFMPITCVETFAYDLALGFIAHDFNYGVIGSLVCNGIIVNTIILILKIKNLQKAKQLGLSEKDYTKKYIYKNV